MPLTVAQHDSLKRMYPGCNFSIVTKKQAIKSILEGLMGTTCRSMTYNVVGGFSLQEMKSSKLPKSIIKVADPSGMTVAVLEGSARDIIYRKRR